VDHGAREKDLALSERAGRFNRSCTPKTTGMHECCTREPSSAAARLCGLKPLNATGSSALGPERRMSPIAG